MGVIVTTKEVKSLMRDALRLRQITGEIAEFIIEDYLEAELEGHKTHGISKFLLIDVGIVQRCGEAKIVKQEGCFAKIDGNHELGHSVGMQAAELAISLAKDHGIGLVAFDHVSRYSRVTPYARMIADAGMIGLLTNNGGPMCVAPFGGKRAIFGTNPLCFAFPSNQEKPYIFDFATSQKVWGEIRQAMMENRPLPSNSFLDETGAFTPDPEAAVAAVPFGGPKGYALCFALEVMVGAFVGAKMGSKAQDEFDLGYLFMALSPDMFTDLETFKKEMDELAEEVRNCDSITPGEQVRIPGELSAMRRHAEEIEIEAGIYERLKKMSQSLEGGLENNKLLN